MESVAIEFPRGWERLVCHGDWVEAGQILAVSVPRGAEPDLRAPSAGFVVGGDLVPWSIEPELPDWARGE